MCRWFKDNLLQDHLFPPLLLPFSRCPLLLLLLLILSRLSSSLFLEKCFKNSLGYLQSGLYSHPTVSCHITAVRSCSGYRWFALGFPIHTAANPMGVEHAVVGDLSPYYQKIKPVKFPVCYLCVWLQHFQLGWAWASWELLLSGQQLWRLANVTPANEVNICFAPANIWVPAVKCKARKNVPATSQTSPGDGHAGIWMWVYNQQELTMTWRPFFFAVP